jgi:hypothetical protein
MPVFAVGRLAVALIALVAGCQAPPATPVASPGGDQTPGPSATPVPAGSAGPTTAPAPSPVVTQAGPLTRLTAPAGQAAEAPSAPGRTLTLVSANPTDRAATATWRTEPGASGTAGYRLAPPAPTGGLVATGDRAALALAAPRPATRRVMQATPRALGATDSFWINTGGFTAETDVRREAVLRRVSAHAYFYVDTGAGTVGDAQLDAFVTAFETTIHPKVTALFGEPAKPGVDGEDRVFVVFSPAVSGFERQTDLLGYFWAPDAVPNPAAGSHSNQKEVLFMSDRLFGAARVQAYGVLAHEFQHLINFTNKGPRLNYAANEATWLDEGMAMLAAEAAGYGLAQGDRLVASSIADYQSAPETYSLTDWAGNPSPAFGQSYLFVRYLVDRHGPEVLKALIASDRRGGEALDAVLAPKGHSFAGLFTDWAITNAWSGAPGAAQAPYRYGDLALTGTYNGVSLPGFRPRAVTGTTHAVSMKPWGVAFQALSAAQPTSWRLRLEAGATSGVAGAAIATP